MWSCSSAVLRGAFRTASSQMAGYTSLVKPTLTATRSFVTPTRVNKTLWMPIRSAIQRTFATEGVAQATAQQPHKAVGYWLFGCCGLVFGTVVVGGVTRLTESGLSIVTWQPIRGVKRPSTQEEWEKEFEKYKAFPEYKYNQKITLEEFKFIFHMEWGHRILGRLVGLAFVLPAAVFWGKGWLLPQHKKSIVGLAGLIGFQGVLGWYMVKSGLDHDPQGAHVPRVSQYRLAAHLGSAFVLYCGMLWTGLQYFPTAVRTIPSYGKLSAAATALSSLIFVTALSGAFVAGLDAGLVYNSFPKMGDDWIPDDILALSPTIKNFFENTTTVQFDHRVLAITTLACINAFFFAARGIPLHRRARVATTALTHMSWLQVILGISTLIYFVPTPLAAVHQAGSLTLLTFAVWAQHELKNIPK